MALDQEKINKIINHSISPSELNEEDLIDFCEYANYKYRSGFPVISDADYDFIFLKILREKVPNHIFFNSVEPEGSSFSEEKVLLPQAMLSIDKAYSYLEIIKWTERILKSADDLNLNYKSLLFKATPKLDGFAGYDDGKNLFTRGDGKKGVI